VYHVSLIDTDLYKLTMQQAICKLYPNVRARYSLKVRDNRNFPEGFAESLRRIVNGFNIIHLQEAEKRFLQEKCYYLNPQYLDFLAGYRYDPSEVQITQTGDRLELTIEGLWYRVVLWEVPLMATISELYFNMTGQEGFGGQPKNRDVTRTKARELDEANVYYSDFGTRRRFSYQNHCNVIEDLKYHGNGHLLGTSNVHLAQKYDLTPLGTVAHEWIMFHGVRYGYKQANYMANEAWVTVYQGDLGTALPDTYTSDAFFNMNSFDTKFAKLYDGLRQDSGDPIVFLEKAQKYYNDLRVNPAHKFILFSDNLKTIAQIKSIHMACVRRGITDRYGIGTWLTNDCGVTPMNMVIKLSGINYGTGWQPAVKLSDDPGKNTGDSTEVELCKQTLGIGRPS
jgi:nicotinate phosphoribosyltransferase